MPEAPFFTPSVLGRWLFLGKRHTFCGPSHFLLIKSFSSITSVLMLLYKERQLAGYRSIPIPVNRTLDNHAPYISIPNRSKYIYFFISPIFVYQWRMPKFCQLQCNSTTRSGLTYLQQLYFTFLTPCYS